MQIPIDQPSIQKKSTGVSPKECGGTVSGPHVYLTSLSTGKLKVTRNEGSKTSHCTQTTRTSHVFCMERVNLVKESRYLNGGLGEGDPEVLAASHVVVVEFHQGLDGLLHGGHLQESHLVILEKLECFHSPATV